MLTWQQVGQPPLYGKVSVSSSSDRDIFLANAGDGSLKNNPAVAKFGLFRLGRDLIIDGFQFPNTSSNSHANCF